MAMKQRHQDRYNKANQETRQHKQQPNQATEQQDGKATK